MSDNMKYTLLLLGALLLGGVLIWELADTLLEAAVVEALAPTAMPKAHHPDIRHCFPHDHEELELWECITNAR